MLIKTKNLNTVTSVNVKNISRQKMKPTARKKHRILRTTKNMGYHRPQMGDTVGS